MVTVSPTELSELLEELFDDPQDLKQLAWQLVERHPDALRKLVASVPFGGSLSWSTFALATELERRGALQHEATVASLRELLLHAFPLQQAAIEAVLGSGSPATAGPGFLDGRSIDFGRPEARELRDLLAGHYRHVEDIERVLEDAAVPLAEVPLQASPRQLWHRALLMAAAHGRARALAERARHDVPEIGALLDAPRTALISADNAIGAAPSTTWRRPEDPKQIERQLAADSALLDIGFLARGLRVAQGVFKITAEFGLSRAYHGTAFRVGPRHFLTAHHVIFDPDVAVDPPVADRLQLQFGYELGEDGKPHDGDLVRVSAFEVVAAQHDDDPPRDWALVAVPEDVVPPAATIVPLRRDGAIAPHAGDRAYIIQHPLGQRKQIGLHRNLIRHVDPDIVQYLTDTDHGSSGAPVFDREWRIIALHYRYIESDEETWYGYRNQGMRIEPVIAELERRGIRLT